MSPAERRTSYSGGEVRVSSESAYRNVSRDPMTGLLNPRALLAIVEHILERAERAAVETSVLFIYLPDPTRTLVGDERLFQLVARFLRRTLRGEDALGRIGNTFLVVLSDCGTDGAEVAARRVVEGLWQNLGLAIAGRWSVEITVSEPAESARDLVGRATASVPGLADAALPHERRPLIRLRQRG